MFPSSFYKIIICFVFFTAFTLSFLQSDENEEDLLQEVPTSYKGRFRPLDAMARLWLEENYHRQAIKASHYNDFHVAGSSALSLLWKIQFAGHQNWDDAPLFWIYSAQLKELLELPLHENYFSYRQLSEAIYEHQKSNLALLKELLTFHFLKTYYDASNRSGSVKLELEQLSPGLWVALKNNQLVVTAVPSYPLWQFLKTGHVVLDQAEKVLPGFIKEHRSLNDEISHLLHELNQFARLEGPYAADKKEYEAIYAEMVQRNAAPMQIAEVLEQEYPLNQRLVNAGTIFKVLPAKNGDWYSLNALTLHTFNPEKRTLEPIRNFTIYPDDQFEKIRTLYFQLMNDYDDAYYKTQLADLLTDNYEFLANQPVQKAWGKNLTYPSLEKLTIEYWYYQLPLIETAIALYGLAIMMLIIGLNRKIRRFTQLGTFLTLVAFAFNTLILAIRCFVLDRPPVSNMFETVIYVPWIAVLTSLLLSTRIKNSIIILGASAVALILLIILKATGLGGSLENVQAVLDSQFWLIIHVLMIVGSYGVFALAGILGQIYLFQYIIHEHETYNMQEIGHAILQALYIGVALLIPGTILGGVWASQSWGRFWDWDPKESWAFISSCIYVIFIHAYRFKHIRYFGLAMGSILGLLAISFTWYGVNYILAVGLHSYGFGSGGEIYYYLFILAELLFLSFVGIFHLKLTKVNNSR